MPTPSNRTPVRIARGTYSNLNSLLQTFLRVRFATPQTKTNYMSRKVAALSLLKLI